MNSCERFRKTIAYSKPDRVPYFVKGRRDDVLQTWRQQGMSRDSELSELSPTDERKDLAPNLNPVPEPTK